ncbi:MAG: hypothetical protein IT236_13100 [Bacteroidia bacterium]|nr:hypothetical protein [Bacteroidia bacterium]
MEKVFYFYLTYCESSMGKIKIVFVVCFLVVVVIACKKDVGKQPVAAPVAAINTCDTITYEKHIRPIIVTNCNACHAPGTLSSGFDLSTYALLKDKASGGKLKKRVIDDLPPASMPQGGAKLPKAQLDLIQCWINNGAKEK